MVTIKRSEILELLAQHRKDTFGFSKTADVIDKLQAFLNPGARDGAGVTLVASRDNTPDALNQDELYKLALILLTREKSMRLFGNPKPRKSEILAKNLEDQFGDGKFQALRSKFDENKGSLTEDECNNILKDGERAEAVDGPFSELDPAIFEKIAMVYLPDAMVLRQVSKHFYSLFNSNPTLSKHITTKPDLLCRLFGHVALGELGDAQKIWEEHPELLTCYGTVFHPNCHYIEGEAPKVIPFEYNPGRYKYIQKTVLQILWMNEDYEAAKLIEDRLNPNEVTRQFFEVFPNGVIKKDNFDLEKANELLQAVLDAITQDSKIKSNDLDAMNDETRKALDALYAYAKPRNDVETGLVFDANFYLAALALYDTKAYGQFKEQWAKYDFWCIRVEEWLAGCLGTSYFRPHAQGLGNQENRLIGCNLADGTSGFAFRRGFRSVPGLHLFVGYYGRGVRMPGACGGLGGRRVTARFRELCQAKNNAAIDLCKRATQTLKQNRIT